MILALARRSGRIPRDIIGYAGKTLGLRISAMTAVLAEATPNNLACRIEREDGKPLTMRCSKTDCDIDGVRTATDELCVMRLTPLGISQR